MLHNSLKISGLYRYSFLVIFLILFSCQENSDDVVPESFEYRFINIEQQPIEQIQELNDWETTGWGVYEDIIFDDTIILHNIEHESSAFNTPTLKTQITGGDQYNNVFFTNTIAKRWEELDWYFGNAKVFEFSLEFYPEVGIDCSQSDLSEVEGLEFTAQHVIIPDSWGWGFQWSKTNTWSYWNDEKVNGQPIGWENLEGINDCIISNEWNKIKFKGTIENNTLSYDYLEINNHSYNLNVVLNKVTIPEGWSENFIQVGFQINGNAATLDNHNHGVDPVTVYLNNLNLHITD